MFNFKFSVCLILSILVWTNGIEAIIEEVIPNEFPWVARVQTASYNDESYRSACHGAIINESWVIVDNICGMDSSSTVTVIAGDHNAMVNEPTEQVRKVIRTVRSSEWERSGEFIIPLGGIISLMQLDEPLEFNEYVQPIRMASLDTVYASNNVTKLLWEFTDGGPPGVLIKNTDDFFMDDGSCASYYNEDITFPYVVDFHPETVLCAGTFPFLSSGCREVNAQPLVCQSTDGPVLCGMGVLYSYDCSGNRQSITIPSTYSVIAYFHDWINDKITMHPESNQTFVSQDEGCGGVINATAGRLSYKLGETVKENERCTWTIRAENWSNIRVKLTSSLSTIRLEDKLVLSDFNGEEPAEFNNILITSDEIEYFVRGPVVFVTFATGPNAQSVEGFSLEFYGSGLNQALSFDSSDVHLEVAEESYHYPDDGSTFYPWWGAGSFVINPENRLNFTMEFTELHVSCSGDNLFIYRWEQQQSGLILVEKICENAGLPSYETEDGIFVILFTSDNQVLGRGFTIEY